MPVAIVTGAGRGIGRQIAQDLAAAGWSVIGTARTASEIEATIAELPGDGHRAVVGDVTDPEHVGAVVAAAAETGDLELLVNNAGVNGDESTIDSADPTAWWQVLEINVRGPMLFTRAALEAMKPRGRGCIINVNSLAGARPFPGYAAYSVSKAALTRFTDCLAVELSGTGITCFDMSPGLVKTKMPDGVSAFADIPDSAWTPIEKSGQLVLALVSGRYDDLTGRFVHAEDDLDDVLARVRANDGRQLRITPAGADDPLFS